MPEPARASVRERAAWSFIRYASVWEDADVLLAALEPVARGGRLLSVASAGDNALALLTLDPAEVVAADFSAAQLACLELRIAAFRALDDRALLGFLGVEPWPARGALYRRLRDALSRTAREFWDRHPAAVERGIIHVGKFERYLRAFGRGVLPLIHSRATREALLAPRSLVEQETFYRERWDNWRWRAVFRLFFSRAVMGRMGRDPEFFAHAGGGVGEAVLERTRHALTRLPTAANPYLAYILTGSYPSGARPAYLRPQNLAAIRARLERITLHHGAVESAGGRFHGFNLSDVFEYMDAAEHARVYRALLDRAEPGARLVYWNMMVPRARPTAHSGRARPLGELARELHARDNAWFYGALHVDEVLG